MRRAAGAPQTEPPPGLLGRFPLPGHGPYSWSPSVRSGIWIWIWNDPDIPAALPATEMADNVFTHRKARLEEHHDASDHLRAKLFLSSVARYFDWPCSNVQRPTHHERGVDCDHLYHVWTPSSHLTPTPDTDTEVVLCQKLKS